MKAYVYLVERVPKRYEDTYPYKKGDHALLIEIGNMPGHGAVVTQEGAERR